MRSEAIEREQAEVELLKLLEEEERFQARSSHLKFMAYTWPFRDRSFTPGFHTRAICKRIDQAFVDFRNGKSTHLLISVPPRHGKTDIVSRWLGPHFLGEFPESEVMQVSYSASLAEQFAAFARNVVRSPGYRELYPAVELSKETNQKSNWTLVDRTGKPTGGKLYASGLKSLTGNGGALITLDDYLSGRRDAESKVIRDNTWDSFKDDMMSRKAPVHIVIVLATQWHVDDVNGRIRQAMRDDPDFPQFEVLRFPAKAKDYRGEGRYPNEYLFEERYNKQYYRAQYATMGRYSAAALMDCDPQMRAGAILSGDNIDFCDSVPGPMDLRWARVWDLAHTKKQRQKDDPDWTRGTKLAFEMRPGDPVPHLWIADSKRIQEGATKRDAFMKTVAKADGYHVAQAIERSMDSKDAYDYIVNSLPDISWKAVDIQGQGDKIVRATPLEPIFEASPPHVHVLRGEWNDAWLDEVLGFDGTDGGTHDEAIDNMSAGYILLGPQSSLRMSADTRAKLAARRQGGR